MADETTAAAEDGFEYQGTFYRWQVTDVGKDLMLIDRFAGIPVLDFFELVEDDHERARGPILLTLIATSIRARHPEWSVERITRLVMNLSLGEVSFLGGDEEEPPLVPPAQEAAPPAAAPSNSPSNGSSSSPTPAESTNSETYSGSPI